MYTVGASKHFELAPPRTAADLFRRYIGRAVVVIWLGATLSGCTSLAGPARVEVMANKPAPAFEGLISADSDRPGIRYIFQTHGINSPGEAWALQLLNAIPHYGYVEDMAASYSWHDAPLARSLEVIGRDVVCDRPHNSCTFNSFGQYRKDVFINAAARRTVIVFSYRWRDDLWSITGHYVTPDIIENTFSGLSTKRSVLNAMLKIGVMDKGFSDAVGYLSSVGAIEREGMETSICAMLADAISLHSAPAGGGCLAKFDPNDLSRLNTVEFNFLSHSLGSRMLYDVLSAIIPENGQARTEGEMQTRGAIRARTHELVMAANQMPLRAASEFHVVPTPTAFAAQTAAVMLPYTKASFVNLGGTVGIQTAHLVGPNLHLTVISFQDPDDLLGFKASDAVIGSNDESVTFVDVLHRNTSQWAFLFAWPLAAHDQELEETNSRQMILCGAESRADGRLKARHC